MIKLIKLNKYWKTLKMLNIQNNSIKIWFKDRLKFIQDSTTSGEFKSKDKKNRMLNFMNIFKRTIVKIQCHKSKMKNKKNEIIDIKK